MADINGDFLPPAEAAIQVQGLVDRGRKRSPHWPHDPISKWYQMSWAPSVVQDGLNNFGSVYGFLAAWMRWGIMALCLTRETDGSRFWSLGQFWSYFFLLMKVGHEATKDPDLQGLTIVTFLQRYDIALRSHFHSRTSTRQAFDLNDFLKDSREQTYKEVKQAYLRAEAEKKKQRPNRDLSSQHPNTPQPLAADAPRRNTFPRGGRRITQPVFQPEPQIQNLAVDTRKPRPAPHSIPTLCRNWEATGKCQYGSECIFQHSTEEKRGAKRPSDESARPTKRER